MILTLSGSGKGGWAWVLRRGREIVGEGSGGRRGASSYAMLVEAYLDARSSLPREAVVHVRNDAFRAVAQRAIAGQAPKPTAASRRLIAALTGETRVLHFVDVAKTDDDYARAKLLAVASVPPAGSEPEPAPGEVFREFPPLDPNAELWIWTDGNCKRNPGPGGWGALIVHAKTGKTLEIWGGEAPSTNNRMELSAVIGALGTLSRGCRIELRVDSTYVRNVATKWGANWKRNGWLKRDGEPVKNQDLVMELDRALAPHRVTWTWVKGHAGEPGNERVDALANRAIERLLRGEEPAGQERHGACPVPLPPVG